MAFLESRNGWYRVVFRLKGERFAKALNTQSERSANACLAKVNDNLHRFELGLIEIPSGRDPLEFFLGRNTRTHTRETVRTEIKSVGIRRAWKIFQETLPEESLEQNTLSGMQTHVDHLARLIGSVTLNQVDKPTLQKYVDDRSKEPGRYGKRVSVQTIKKELRTLSTIWGWMKDRKLVKHAFPNRKLRYPKFHEKPPFQTWVQIESRIKRGGLSKYQVRELWDSLFLSVYEIEAALSHVKANARQEVIYPMICFAAFTGARRSEVMRSQLEDLDFENSVITIREKKRLRGKLSTRRVPMQPRLKDVLENWLEIHPGTNFTFAGCKAGQSEIGGITCDQASNFFEKTFSRSKWQVLHGWHLFRHSFCSNCAAAGIEQRVIRQWVGHQTEEMMRRYLHLFPNNELKDIEKVFST